MKPGDHAQLSAKNDFDIKTVNPERLFSFFLRRVAAFGRRVFQCTCHQ
jgi:hypothetical protein